MEIKKESLKVAFSTQKGGAGKTTLTVIVASYLQYIKNQNVIVVDCDYPQHSISEMRQRDLKMIQEDDFYKQLAFELFNSTDKKAFTIIESTPQHALEDAQEDIEELKPDFVFFDLPGTINNQEVVRTLSKMDYIIAPISADRLVLESTLQFVLAIHDELITTGKSNIKGVYFLWNMVDGREKTELYNVYEEVIEKLGFPILKTFIPDSKRFRKEQSESHKAIFRSTMFPPDKLLVKGSNIDSLINELLEILK